MNSIRKASLAALIGTLAVSASALATSSSTFSASLERPECWERSIGNGALKRIAGATCGATHEDVVFPIQNGGTYSRGLVFVSNPVDAHIDCVTRVYNTAGVQVGQNGTRLTASGLQTIDTGGITQPERGYSILRCSVPVDARILGAQYW